MWLLYELTIRLIIDELKPVVDYTIELALISQSEELLLLYIHLADDNDRGNQNGRRRGHEIGCFFYRKSQIAYV
uniref:Uncharacterized protein n=1 Tax=Oryza brachyantha TaxID=4533 RepID=J3N887_ORYBR